MKRTILTMLILFFLTQLVFAQGEGVFAVSTLQRSLPLIGAGQIGAAKANNDPLGYYLNPAILGYASQNNHASFFFMPSESKWGGSAIASNLTLNTFGFNVGYNFEKYNIPISVGLGYMHDTFSYGSINGRESYDSFDNFSLGVGVDYYLLFTFGVSYKPFVSHMNLLSTEMESSEISAEGSLFDYGAMIVAPLSKLFLNNINYNISQNTYLKPLANFTLGYSTINIGDEISYFDPAQKDPIARIARLGYTLDFGFDAFINSTKINVFTYSFTAEAEDNLLEYESPESYFSSPFLGYQSFLGDINISENLIQLKANENVVVHKGHTFNLFETLTITTGSYTGRYYVKPLKTNGYGFSSEGITKLIANLSGNKTLGYIAKHVVLDFYDVTLFAESEIETQMQGISLHFKNINL